MKLPAFDYAAPGTLDEAVRLLASGAGTSKVLAGGQSLMPMLAFRLASPSLLVDLNGIADLGSIRVDQAGVTFGAMVRWCEIEADDRLRAACPLVAAAVGHIAHYQVRNRGTIGGSIAHADPAAEMPGVAVTCGAEIDIAGPEGTRSLAAEDFFLGPLMTRLRHDEIIRDIRFPAWPSGRRWAFDEFAPRRGDFAYAGIALHYDEQPDGTVRHARVGVIGSTDRPRRLPGVEAALEGARIDTEAIAKAALVGAQAVDPDDDILASADYRRALVGTLIERALVQASTRKAGA